MIDKSNLINSLNRIYHESKESSNFEKLVEILEGIKINNLVNYYIHYDKEYDSEDIIIIELIIKILQNIYNNSEVIPPISDEMYDTLYEIFIGITNSDIVGGDVDNNREKDFHRYPDLRGTLDKVHFITNEEKGKDKRKSIENWLVTCENRLGREFTKDELNVTLYPKFDGVSAIFECDRDGNTIKVLTRGNTKNNEAVPITTLFKYIKFKPLEEWKGSEFAVKTEIIMTYKNYEKFCKKYGNKKSPRSAVSSIANSIEVVPDYLHYVTIVPLRMQNYDTKEVIVYPDTTFPAIEVSLSNKNNLKDTISYFKMFMKDVADVPIDGVVLRFNDKNIINLLGREDAINKYEVAYKFAPDGVKTKILDIEFSIGILGNITPVAKIKPIKMEGNTISNVSLGSIDRFESLHLSKNDEVLIKYDIIPYLYINDTCKRSDEPLFKTITHCPYCGEKLIVDPILRCGNNDCPSRMMGKIINYIDKMDIRELGEGKVSTLFKLGYLKSIEDLYSLKKHKSDIAQIDGFGSKSVEKMISAIDDRRTVMDYNLLGSLGIPDAGSKKFKKILSIYYIDELIKICEKHNVIKLIEIPGIQEKTANKIIVGILQNLDLINFLKKELLIKHDNVEYTMKVVFTKIRDKKFEEYLESKNIEVCDSYNKKVDIVICADKNTNSDKIKKAKKDGKLVLSLDEAYKYFKYK